MPARVRNIVCWFLAVACVAAFSVPAGALTAFADEPDDVLIVQDEIEEDSEGSELFVPDFEGDYADDEVIVVYEDEADESLPATEETVDSQELIANADADSGAIAVAELAAGVTVAEAVAELSDVPGVAYVQPNYSYSIAAATNDPYCVETGSSNQYYLYKSGFPTAWNTVTGSGSTIAVIDTGCDLDHPDLAPNILAPLAYDACSKVLLNTETASGADDEHGHGTHVCGIISATANNGIGLAGASYNARLLPIKVRNSDGRISTSTTVAAYAYIDDLLDRGAVSNLRVINMSLGGSVDDQLLHDAISSMRSEHNVLTVCAAGNDGAATPSYPSDYPECLSVMALAEDGTPASFSDYNASKDIYAYGDAVLSTYPGGRYARLGGTSMAAPLVASAAALCWVANPAASVERVISALTSTESSVNGTKVAGVGALNVLGALEDVVDLPVVPEGVPVQIRCVGNSSLVLDAAGGTPRSGANVSAWASNGGANQLWLFEQQSNGTYVIRNAANASLVLDAAGAVPSRGANISVWTPNGGANQRWKLAKDSSGRITIVSAANSSLVLDAEGVSPRSGANISVWTQNGGSNQRWSFAVYNDVSLARASASGLLRNECGRSLEASVSVSLAGRTLVQGSEYQVLYNGSTSTPSTAGSYTVSIRGIGRYTGTKNLGTMKIYPAVECETAVLACVANSALVLDAAGAAPRSGANVSVWSSNGGRNQQWTLQQGTDGYYSIVSLANSWLCLDAAGANPASGANISAWSSNGGMNQKWVFEPRGDGTYTVRCAANTSLVLDAEGASPRSGANISVWSPNGGANQAWRML